MTSFTHPLTVTKISTNQWRIDRPFKYYIDEPNGKLIYVHEGFVTDFASVPRIFWVLFPPATGNYVQAAVLHDYLCDGGPVFIDGIPTKISIRQINAIFLQSMKVLDTPVYQRYPMFFAVSLYFKFFHNKKNKKAVENFPLM